MLLSNYPEFCWWCFRNLQKTHLWLSSKSWRLLMVTSFFDHWLFWSAPKNLYLKLKSPFFLTIHAIVPNKIPKDLKLKSHILTFSDCLWYWWHPQLSWLLMLEKWPRKPTCDHRHTSLAAWFRLAVSSRRMVCSSTYAWMGPEGVTAPNFHGFFRG